MIRTSGNGNFSGKFTLREADKKQIYLLNRILEFNSRTRPGSREDNKRK